MAHRTVCGTGGRGALRVGLHWGARSIGFTMLLATLASGCLGSLGDPDQDLPDILDGFFAGSSTGAGGESSGGGANGPGAEILAVEELAFPRLSHNQWENTVQSLLHLDAPPGLSSSFYPDPSASSTFDNNKDSKSVTADLWADYERAAEELGAMVAADPSMIAKIVAPSDPTSASAFIDTFVTRAYRRPLTSAEKATYLALFEQGPSLSDPTTDGFAAGVGLVVEAVLQSPHFIYRVELGGPVDDEGLQTLSGWEIATKLSYTLWNDMPDDDLFAAASAGRLDDAEGVAVEIDRLLGSERAKANMVSFVDQIFQAEQFEAVTKNEDVFPGWDAETAADLREELSRFTANVVFDEDGGLEDLLLSRTTFVNARVARIYGLEGDFTDDTFTRVDLDETQRAGLLTLAGFLAWKGSQAGTPDSILRGVFVNRNILCTHLPDPPDEAAGQTPHDGVTNREKIENLTGVGTCGEGCHSTYINPVGFGLEKYDGFGRFQTTDAGQPIDSKGELAFEEGAVAFDGAVQLSEAIAASDEAHQCFAKHWIEFEFGRELVDEDEGLIDHVATLSREGASVRGIVRELLTSKAFLKKKAVTQ